MLNEEDRQFIQIIINMTTQERSDLLSNMALEEVIDIITKMYEYSEEVLEEQIVESDLAEAKEVIRMVSGSYPKN